MAKAKIKDIQAAEILDSRGNPTIAVSVFTDKGKGVFSVPSGVSAGSHEAVEKRDGDKARFQGLGVKSAIESVVRKIAPALVGMEAENQSGIDETMIALDGTPNKSKLGGNAMIGVSIACAKAAAASLGVETFEYLKRLSPLKGKDEMPYLFINLVEGGKHGHNRLAFQEYHIVPMTHDLNEAIHLGNQVQFYLREKVEKELGPSSVNLGDEGGIAPDESRVEEPLKWLSAVLEERGLRDSVKLSLDTAASSFCEDGKYAIDSKSIAAGELLGIYLRLLKKYPIISIEDPFDEEAFDDFSRLLKDAPEVKVVGDDLTVTNPERILRAAKNRSVNAVIIKPNQIGTLTETIRAMEIASKNNLSCIASHRAGETDDDFIADLAFAFGCFGLKAGALRGGERVAKYNRLWNIHPHTN